MASRYASQVAQIAARSAALVVLGAVLFALAVLVVVPKATHGAALTVLTGSMTPGIPVGSVVLDRPVDPGTLRVGDVATYQKAPGKAEFVTHRIVAIDSSKTPVMFTFKGDANRGPDPQEVPATAIRGRVWFHVRYLGELRDMVHTKAGLSGIGMLVLAGFGLFQLIGWIVERRRLGASSNTRVEETAPAPGRVLVVVPASAFDGMNKRAIGRLLGGKVQHSDDDRVTVQLSEKSQAVEAALALLHERGRLHLVTTSYTFGEDPTTIETSVPGCEAESGALARLGGRRLVSLDA